MLDLLLVAGVDLVHLVQVAVEDRAARRDDEFQEQLLAAKRIGFGDGELARLRGVDEDEIRSLRHELGIRPVFKTVDTCAGEFPAATPYLYSTYETENESVRSDRRKVVILGSGPNRIGQGVEFDYCCVSASLALGEAGIETIMVNSNPETVSTDFDISDKLYFEPLTLEDILNIVEAEDPVGVVVQFGGQTPLNLATTLEAHEVALPGISVEAIDRAEERTRFATMIEALGIPQPRGGMATSLDEALAVADEIGGLASRARTHYDLKRIRELYLKSRRYGDLLEDAEGEVLDEATRTIVAQVEGLKHLVNEFSRFAKMPESRPVPTELNGVVEEVRRTTIVAVPSAIWSAKKIRALPRCSR